ncbi:DNA polymerase beta superfamily protein [Bacillus sp. REN16]|uniref:DNA polymerase beta superfamily protein n=1 Tax=Bacillus sp. REN16 TaxID=2887296 RepID=UPI001E46D57B|nr:nucleotidyltransferase domain-containing protein [Bacillus sp. REN16]MCC3357264.1 nucleotidyltransferase domain-containing protein [Bacillus sp. REN16]
MKDHILEILTQVEKDYDIKILYACEAGSRMWGTSSEESDYDVRFIYIHRMDWYLSIDQKRDVIGVASGKCGFTTIRNFQYKKPDFPSPKLRN